MDPPDNYQTTWQQNQNQSLLYHKSFFVKTLDMLNIYNLGMYNVKVYMHLPVVISFDPGNLHDVHWLSW